jgi:hypothetical protein
MCHRFAVATVPGGVAGYGEPGVGLGGPPVGTSGRTFWSRLGRAAALLAVAAAAGGLTYATGRESGLAAITGRPALAHTSHCRGARVRLCDAEVIGLDGSLINADATMSGFTRVAENADVHVRYRAGRAAPDTLPERSAEAGLMLFLAGSAAAALIGAVIALTARSGQAAVATAAVPVVAVPLFVVSLLATLFVGAPTLSAGQLPVPDIYARVAAGPGRTLNAQGVQFELVDNQPMSRAGCFAAPGCVVGAVAHWRVTGTDLVATSHLLVFDDGGLAAATKDTIQRTRALPNAPVPPAGAIVAGIGSGRYASAIWISRADGSQVRDDPEAVPALRGLGYFNIDPAVAEGMRSGFKH